MQEVSGREQSSKRDSWTYCNLVHSKSDLSNPEGKGELKISPIKGDFLRLVSLGAALLVLSPGTVLTRGQGGVAAAGGKRG